VGLPFRTFAFLNAFRRRLCVRALLISLLLVSFWIYFSVFSSNPTKTSLSLSLPPWTTQRCVINSREHSSTKQARTTTSNKCPRNVRLGISFILVHCPRSGSISSRKSGVSSLYSLAHPSSGSSTWLRRWFRYVETLAKRHVVISLFHHG